MILRPDLLKIVIYPDPILRTKATPIDQVTEQVQQVARKMLQLMHDAPGVGLAGPQVGLPWRMFVANPTGTAGDDRVFINPVLHEPSRQVEDAEEGCLSLPGINVQIRRPKKVTIKALDEEGHDFEVTCDDVRARVWQHEYDHLDGILILDRMAPIDRIANEKAIKDLEQGK